MTQRGRREWRVRASFSGSEVEDISSCLRRPNDFYEKSAYNFTKVARMQESKWGVWGVNRPLFEAIFVGKRRRDVE